MEDYIYQIRKYLPIEFADDEANEFLQYLEETYLENIRNRKYQFAFIAFHMLYMTFCYKTKWFLKTQNNKEIIRSLQDFIKRHKKVFFNLLFDLSRFPERGTFECLLSSLKGFSLNDIDKCQIHVTRRNHCVHASGKVEYKEKDIDYTISDELKYIERIQSRIKPDLVNFFGEFISNNWSKLLVEGDIKNFIINNNISRKDLEIIVNLDLTLFKKKSDNTKAVFQKILCLIFVYEAQKYLEMEKNIFLEKLPMFMFGLVEEIEIKQNGEKKKVLVQEIIEERIIPIISGFVDEERKEAEKILKLE